MKTVVLEIWRCCQKKIPVLHLQVLMTRDQKKERQEAQTDMTLIKLQKLRRLGFLLMIWANRMENLP